MKIDKSFILYVLVVFLLISLSFNIKSCEEGDVPTVDKNQRKIDSLYNANQQIQARIDAAMADVKRNDSIVSVLNGDLERVKSDLRSARAQIKKQKDIIADNDRKINHVKNSDVKLTDSELTDFLNTKFPK